MKNWISVLLVFLLGASLSGCGTMSSTSNSPNPDQSKEYIGLFSGAIIGGLAGSAINQKGGGRLTAISLGAVVGAIAGFALGKFMDDQDHDRALSLAGKNPYAQPKTKSLQQPTSHWWQAMNPLAPRVTTAAKIMPVKIVNTQEKEVAMIQSTQDGNLPSKKQKPTPTASPTDKFLSLWRNLPSTQWFVNDMKQQDVG